MSVFLKTLLSGFASIEIGKSNCPKLKQKFIFPVENETFDSLAAFREDCGQKTGPILKYTYKGIFEVSPL